MKPEELKCGGCGKTVKCGTVWIGRVYGFYGTPVCEECVKKRKPIPLDPEREIGLILKGQGGLV